MLSIKSLSRKTGLWSTAIVFLLVGISTYALVDRTQVSSEQLFIIPGAVSSDSWSVVENALVSDGDDYFLYQDFSTANAAWIDKSLFEVEVESPVFQEPTTDDTDNGESPVGEESPVDEVDPTTPAEEEGAEVENPSSEEPTPEAAPEEESEQPVVEEETETSEPEPASDPVSQESAPVLFGVLQRAERFPLLQATTDTSVTTTALEAEQTPAEEIETETEAAVEEVVEESQPEEEVVPELEGLGEAVGSETEETEQAPPSAESEEIESAPGGDETPVVPGTEDILETEMVDEVEEETEPVFSVMDACLGDADCALYPTTFTGFSIPEFELGTLLTATQLRLSLGAQTVGGDAVGVQRFVVEYSYGENEPWQLATVIDIEDEISNSINGGYFLVSLDRPIQQNQVANLQVRVSYQGNIEYLKKAFIESVWLEVTSSAFYEDTDPNFDKDMLDYERGLALPKFHDLQTQELDISIGELPAFTMSYDPQKNIISRALTAVFGENVYSVEQVSLVDSTGAVLNAPFEIIYQEEKMWTLQMQKYPQKLLPGKYQLQITVNENDTLYTDSFEFYWGVLAVNTEKSMYAPNEPVTLNLAALTDRGDTICDADLALKIIDPDNTIHEVEVEQSGACGKNNVTDVPDYLAQYAETKAVGVYTIQLEHKNREGHVVHKMADSFEVRDYIPFDIKRTAPTRIYPPAPYTVTLEITANRTFTGDIVERVPRGFVFAETSGAEVTTLEDTTILTWKDVTLEVGDELELSYVFDAPDISPYMYLLGPLNMEGFEELRQWQIASDAISSVAWLTATRTQLGTNLNDSTPSALLWSTSTVDAFYFNHSTSSTPERLFVEKDGDFMVSVTLPLERNDTATAWARVGFEVRVNGTRVPQAVGRSGLIYNVSSGPGRQNESSSHGNFLLTDLSAGDYIEVYAQALTDYVAQPITITGRASMYVEHIASGSGVFAATATGTISSSTLNTDTAAEMSWTETRQDTGFVHSDSVNPEDIIISDPGTYLVFVNIPMETRGTVNPYRNVLGRVLLNGTQVSGGVFSQGTQIVTANLDYFSSSHWSGIVVSTTSNQILSISTEREANVGTTTVPAGLAASIYIQKLPSEDIIALRGRNLSGGTNWNVDPAQRVLFDTQLAYDSSVFTHSTTTNSDQITINEGGDYLLSYNDALFINGGTNNVIVSVAVNSVRVSGAQTKTHYTSNSSGQQDSSGSLVYNLEGLSPGDVVTIQALRDANTTVADDRTDAVLLLWKKKEFNFRPEAPSTFAAPFDNVRFASTTPYFDFSSTDPDGSSSLVYEFSIATSSDFLSAVTRVSDVDGGFTNITTPADTTPFTEGNLIRFTLPPADALLNGETYYWRARAKDVAGSDEFGDWSIVESLTVDTTSDLPDWYQSEANQFLSNDLIGVRTDSNGRAVVDVAENSEALLVYGDKTETVMMYRFWNGSTWTTQTNGPDLGGEIYWAESSAGNTRDEYVAAFITSDADVNALVYSASTSVWGNQVELVTNVNTPARRGLAVAHESLSGDAMVISCSSGADPVYTIWNGSSWSATTTLDVAATNNCNWLTIASDPTSDELILVYKAAADNYEAHVWDGSAWGDAVVLGRVAGASVLTDGMSVVYEESGDQAVVVTSDGSDNEFRYATWNGADWSTVFTVPVTSDFENGHLVADSGTDRIGFCMVDDGSDINVFMWDGAVWGSETQLEPTTESVQSRPFDCEFETVPGRDGNFLVAYSDANTDEYQYFDTAWSGPLNMSDMEEFWYLQTVRTGDGTILAVGMENQGIDPLRASAFNGTSWSNNTLIQANPAETNADPRSESFALSARRFNFSEGTMLTRPIDFSFVPNRVTWGDLSFSTTEPVGASVLVRVKYSNVGTCDAYIPGAALPGNDTGFTADLAPINLSGLSTTTYDQICLEARITTAGDTSASLDDWNLTWIRQPKLIQSEYGWYTNGSFLTPLDPWPLGIVDTLINTPLTAADAISVDEVIRLRLSLRGLNIDTPAFTEAFKLQYAEGLTCSPTLAWKDVGGIGSTTALFRGSENSVAGGDWYDVDWKRRIKITVEDTLVDANLTDFPVYINLADLPSAFFNGVKSDGSDIRITEGDGITELPYELVSINTSQESGELHFKADLASTTDTEFFVYYNNPSASAYSVVAPYGRNAVWSNAYSAVYHLDTNPAVSNIDSTGNGLNLTAAGGSGMGAGNSTSSPVGNGLFFDGVNDRLINAGITWPNTNNAVTVTAWNNVSTAQVQNSNLFGFTVAGNERFATHAPWLDNTIYWDYGTCCASPGRVSTNYTTYRNKWTHVALVSAGASGSFMGIYLDGSLITSLGTSDDPNVTLTGFSLGSDSPGGGNHHRGRIDEFRIATVARSAGWISTEENNQANPTGFYTLSSEEFVSDGRLLPSTLLASSTYPETYEEENPTRDNQNLIVVGENAEWDFVLQNNGAAADTNYCFRMVYEDGAVLSSYDRYPRLITNAPPLQPDLFAPFDNEQTASTTPWFEFAASDELDDLVSYEIEIDTENTFSSPDIARESTVNFAEFTNLSVPSERGLYTSGQIIQFIPNTALSNGTTYWWRVRARDNEGSGATGEWSDPKSFTVDTGTTITTWYQTTEEQFDTNSLVDTDANVADDVRIATGFSAGTITSTPIDFDDVDTGNAWGLLQFSDNESSGDIKYSLEYLVSGNVWEIIPNSDLAGNESGFDTTGVNIANLNTTLYNTIRVRATLTGNDSLPRLLSWAVLWGQKIEEPTLESPFDNAKVNTTEPTLQFVTTDPQGDQMEYEVEVSESADFAVSTTYVSGTDSGFLNSDTLIDTSPFISGDTITYEFQAPLSNGVTYWWRVRARDINDENAYSDWSRANSFTVDAGLPVSMWFQTTGEQFTTNENRNIETTATQAQITSTITEAMVAYGESTSFLPRYRVWDGTSFGDPQNALSVGALIEWSALEAGTKRNEYTLATLGTDGDVNLQVYNGLTSTWGNQTELVTEIVNTGFRGMNIAYETDSGDLLAVACEGNDAVYTIWNGGGWSATSSIALTRPAECQAIVMAAHPETDEIIAVFRHANTGSPDFEALVWNGSSWGDSLTFGDVSVAGAESMAVEYEESGDQAVVVVGNGTGANFIFNTWNGSSWSGSITNALQDRFQHGKIARAVGSDRLALCAIDIDNQISTTFWDGTAWGSYTTLTTIGNDNQGRPVSCEFETVGARAGYLMIPYSDNAATRYQVYATSSYSGQLTLGAFTDAYTTITKRTADGKILAVYLQDEGVAPADRYEFGYWDGTVWGGFETLSGTPSVNGTPFHESIALAAQTFPNFVDGTIRSTAINFADGGSPRWETIDWNDTTPGSSQILYRVYYETSPGTFALVPDSALAGNAAGISTGPIDITDLDPLVYDTLKLEAELVCASGICPSLQDWSVAWSEGITISGMAFTYDQMTALASGTVAVAVNGVLQTGKIGEISSSVGTQKQVFTTTGTTTFTVPSGVTSLSVKAWGAGGGGGGGGIANSGAPGGGGGFSAGTIAVTPAENLLVHVGGGGALGAYSSPGGGGGGGGFSGLYRTSTPLILAGGGGGGGGGAGGVAYAGVGEACVQTNGICAPGVPDNVEPNDILIAVVHSVTGTLNHTCTSNSCAGWTEFSTQATGNGRLSVWWKRYGTEDGPVAPVFSGSTNSFTARIWAFRGVEQSGNPFDQVTANASQAANTTYSGSNIVSTVPNTMMVFVGGSLDNNTWGPGGGSCSVPSGVDADFYTENALSSNNSIFLCFDGTPINGVGSLGVPTMIQATLGADAGRHFAFNLRPETSATVPNAGSGGVGGGVLGGVGTPSDQGTAFSATGGTTSDVNGYRLHTFTSGGTFTATGTSRLVDVLLMGGGGGGGGYRYGGGGGGAGGFRMISSVLSPTSYAVTVGAGGAGGDNTIATTTGNGQNGSNSLFAGYEALGGGGGQRGDRPNDGTTGLSGASGGGGGASNVNGVSRAGGAGTTTQGYAGGVSSNSNGVNDQAGGGGGGVSTSTVNGTTANGGNGGAGINLSGWFGTGVGASGFFGGGGGGGKRSTEVAGTGGAGGGGAGGVGTNNGVTATANTGGGGGGAGGSATTQFGGAGGSGVVIARYRLPILGGAGGTQSTGGAGSFGGVTGGSVTGGAGDSGTGGGAGGAGGVLGGGAGGTGFAATGEAGAGGGGAGYFGGGGGARGVDASFSGSGGGGGSSFTVGSATATTTISGAGSSPANTGDADYSSSGVGGSGGSVGSNGTNGLGGRVVLSWTGSTTPGVWSIPNVNVQVGDVVTVFIISSDGTKEAVSVTKYDGTGDISGVQLSERHLTLGSDDQPTITNADLEVYKNTDNEDVFYTVTGANVLSLCAETTCTDARLRILQNTTYQPGALGSIINFQNNGTFAPATNTLRVSGGWRQLGTFVPDASTIIFTATSGAPLLESATTTYQFNNVTFGETSGAATWTLDKLLDVNGTLSINFGTLARAAQALTVAGNVSIGSSGAVSGLGTTTFDGSGTNTWSDAKASSSSSNLGYVVIDGTAKTITLAGNVGAETVTIQSDDTLNSSGSGFNINVVRAWTNLNTFIPQTGTVTMVGTSTGVINRGSSAFNNLTFSGVGGNWSFSTSTLALTGTLTIATGTVTLPTGTTTIGGSFLNTGGVFAHNNGEVRMTSTSGGRTITQRATSFLNNFYDLVFSGSGAWSFSETNATTTRNFRVQSGSVTLPSGQLTVGGDYIISGTGAFLHNNGEVVLLVENANSVRANGSSFNNVRTKGSGVGSWYNSSWNNRKAITVNASQVISTVTDFPVYVNLANLGADFFSTVKSDGSDIRVTTNNGITELPFEIVSINTGGQSGELYFRAPSLSTTTNTTFYLYYGNSSASGYASTTAFGSQNVWSNGFEAVYHLGTSPASTMFDSTRNNRHLTQQGGMDGTDSVAGVLGNAVDFDGVNDYLRNTTFAWPNASNTVTVTAWNNVTTAETRAANLFGFTESGGQRFATHGPWSDAVLYWDFGTAVVPGRVSTAYNSYRDKWTHVGLTSPGAGGGNMSIYLDGTFITSSGATDPSVTLTGFSLGSLGAGQYHDGRIDEFRIASVVRTAGWIGTEENNQASSTAFYSVSGAEVRQARIFTDTNATILGNFNLDIGGDATFPTGVLSIGGSLDNKALFSSNNGTVRFNSSSGSETIAVGSSTFASLDFNNVSGDFTITENATATAAITLTNASQFTLGSGRTLTALGTFSNAINPANTTWTGSTLAFLGADQTINTKASLGDTYATLRGEGDTDIAMWNSSASVYSTASTSSFYSQDHAGVDGALNIYGNYVRSTGTEFWSHATDFDGTALGSSSRQANVRVASSSSVGFVNASLNLVGSPTASTTIAAQAGAFALNASNTTISAEHFTVAGTGVSGFGLQASTTLATFRDGFFTVLPGQTGITLSSSTVTRNASAQYFRIGFATTTAGSATNVTLVGTTSSFVWFREGAGNLYGENFDAGDTNPGSVRWDDSSNSIVVSGVVYSNTGTTPLGAPTCNGVTNNVRIVVNNGSYASSTSCNASTGAYSFPAVTYVGDPTITVYLDTNGGAKGTVVTKTPSGSITNMHVYANRVITRHQDAAPLTIADMVQFDNDNDSDVSFIAATSSTNTLTLLPNTELFVFASTTFAPGGEMTLLGNGNSNDYEGTLQIGANAAFTASGTQTHRLSGRFVMATTSSFTAASSTFIFTATTSGKSITAVATTTFNNVIFNGLGGGWNITAPLLLQGDMTIGTGTVTGTSNITLNTGSLSGNGLLSLGGGTVTLARTNSLGGTSAWTFNNLTLGNGSVVGTTTPLSSATTTILGQLRIANAHFLDAGSASFDLAGTGTVFVEQGSFLEDTSTIRYSGSGATILSTTYYNLLLSAGAGSATYTTLGSGALVLNRLAVGGGTNSTLNINTNDTPVEVRGDTVIGTNGTLQASNSTTLTLRGNYTNDGTFVGNGGTVAFTGSSTTQIAAGNSAFSAVQINGTGDFTIVENATTTGNFSLINHNTFTVNSGTTLAVGGTFLNNLAGGATNWTGSNLLLYGVGTYEINDSGTTDAYETLSVGSSTQIRMWNSEAATYSIHPLGSLYSMDHESVDGDLYVYGRLVRTLGDDYWSYDTDFDGADLSGGAERQANVYFASGTTALWNGATLTALGGVSATTTVQNQGSGLFDITFGTGSEINWNRVQVRNIGANGVTFAGTPEVINFSRTNHLVTANSGTALTVGGTVITANEAKSFTGNVFEADTGVTGASNVRATGTAVSSWRFTNHTGNIAGENFDDDPAGNPGYITFDDSAALITISGIVYSDEGSTLSSICDGSTNNIRLVVANDSTDNIYNTSCDASSRVYTFSSIPYSPNDTIVAYIVGETEEAAHVTVDPISSISNLHLYENRIIVRHENTDPITIADIAVWDSSNDAEIPYTAVDSSPDTLTVPINRKLIIWTGKTFEPNGNVTLTAGGSGSAWDGTLEAQTNARFRAKGTENHSIGGSVIFATGAEYVAASSTLTLTTTGASRTLDVNNATIHNLTLSGSGSYVITDQTLTTTGSYTQSAGALTLPTGTTTIGASYTVTGGSFSNNGGTMSFIGSGAQTVRFNNSVAGALSFSGTGAFTMSDTNATTTGSFTMTQGTVTLPSGNFAIGRNFEKRGGTLAHNTSDLVFTATSTATLLASSSDLFAARFVGPATFTILDQNITFLDSFTVASGTVLMASGTTAIGGSLVATSGTFVHATGTILLNAPATGRVVQVGNNTIHNLQVGAPSGGYTFSSATTTNNFTLASVNNFTLSGGATLTVGGIFTNSVSSAATTWTGSILNLTSGSAYSINTRLNQGDTYGTLRVGSNTDIRTWYSSAATTTVDASGSLYSMDHSAVNGALNIYGDLVLATSTEYWNYATDFDGTVLTSGNERKVTVRFAPNATTTVVSGALQITGTALQKTVLTNQGTGTYAMIINGGTLSATHYEMSNLSSGGLQLSNLSTITDLSNGLFTLTTNGGSLITLASTTLNTNASKIFTNVGFNATGSLSGTNVQLIGETVNAWRFASSYGNLDGEAFDIDGIDACGSIRFDDSLCLLTEQTHYRWRNDNGGEAVPTSEWYNLDWEYRKQIRIENATADAYASTAVKIAVTYDSDMQANFADLRFTSNNGLTEIPHWIERFTASTDAIVWVRVPTIAASEVASVFMYYGNPTASSTSLGTATFAAFDSFEDNNISEYSGDLSLFQTDTTPVFGGTYALEAQNKSGRTTNGIFRTDQTTTRGQIIRYMQYVSTDGDDACTAFAVQSGGSNYAVCLIRFGVDRVAIVEDVNDSDSSGTVLASTTMTFATGWYEVEIDWRTNNTITVYVYNSAGALVATTSATDSTYTSGGFGFTFWVNNGSWDSFTARATGPRRPAVYTGVEQTFGGASWVNTQDTPGSALPGDIRRLRFAIENSGLDITGQEFRLEYALRGVAPSCESVPEVSYAPVPNQATCGSSPVCMATSTNVTDNQTTTDLLSGTNGTFSLGRIIANPQNRTVAIDVDQDHYTELEYVLTPTVNATDALCFKVTNNGTPLDYYATVAELGLQFDPTVSTVSFNDGLDIALISGTTTTVTATATVTDFNGFADLAHATATFYRTLAPNGAACTPDNNNCYVTSTASNTCSFVGCSGASCELVCRAEIFFHADATDSGVYDGEEWFAFMEVEDGSAVRGFNSSPGIELLTLRALQVDASINYGALAVNEDTGTFNPTTTITNLGNVPIDVDVEGTDLTDGAESVIPAEQQKVSTSTFAYTACVSCQQLSSTTPITLAINLSKPSTIVPPVETEVYWGIAVPFGTNSVPHSGVNIFTPISPN